MQQLAKELIELRPDLIQVTSTPATAAVLRETHTIPVVFTRFGSDWLRIRRKFCSTGRQCDWICQS